MSVHEGLYWGYREAQKAPEANTFILDEHHDNIAEPPTALELGAACRRFKNPSSY